MQINRLVSWGLGSLLVIGTGLTAQANKPVFQYIFPASNGVGANIIDQSSAGNNGFANSTVTTDSDVPPGATGGTESIGTTSGAIITDANELLKNTTVAAAGGYLYDVSFTWNGTDSGSFGHVEKIIDYAGTESLQLTTTSGSAALQMSYDDTTIALSTTILPNIWYHAIAEFNSEGNAVDGSGNLAGMASLTLTDLTDSGSPVTTGPVTATKTAQGDGLDRPIGVGELGSSFGYLVGFKGEIYNPSVSLLPEPASLSLLALLAPTVLGRRRRMIRRA